MDCHSLTSAPGCYVDGSLWDYCCAHMFKNCTGLTETPYLFNTGSSSYAVKGKYVYYGMFEGCTNLTQIFSSIKLTVATSSTSLTGGMQEMFKGCTSLQSAPFYLSYTGSTDMVPTDFYSGMFEGCTSLTKTPTISAKYMYSGCFKNMFKGCTSLTTANVTFNYDKYAWMSENTCYGMFEGCTSLTKAPQIPAYKSSYLYDGCFERMFYGCTNLKYISYQPTTWNESATKDWVTNVSPTGCFITNANETRGVSWIPVGWAINGYSVKVDTKGWASLYFEKALTIPNGVTVYYASEQKENGRIALEPITGAIPANTGVILSAAQGDYSFIIPTSTPQAISGNNLLTGVLINTPVINLEGPNKDFVYVLDSGTTTDGNPQFAKYSAYTGDEPRVLGAYKAYLPASAVNITAAKLETVISEETTGISETLTSTLSEGNGIMYNLHGVRVNANYKGVVMMNGKKYLVK